MTRPPVPTRLRACSLRKMLAHACKVSTGAPLDVQPWSGSRGAPVQVLGRRQVWGPEAAIPPGAHGGHGLPAGPPSAVRAMSHSPPEHCSSSYGAGGTQVGTKGLLLRSVGGRGLDPENLILRRREWETTMEGARDALSLLQGQGFCGPRGTLLGLDATCVLGPAVAGCVPGRTIYPGPPRSPSCRGQEKTGSPGAPGGAHGRGRSQEPQGQGVPTALQGMPPHCVLSLGWFCRFSHPPAPDRESAGLGNAPCWPPGGPRASSLVKSSEEVLA